MKQSKIGNDLILKRPHLFLCSHSIQFSIFIFFFFFPLIPCSASSDAVNSRVHRGCNWYWASGLLGAVNTFSEK